MTDAGTEHDRIGNSQDAVIGHHRDVRQTDAENFHVQNARHAGANADAVAHDKRSSKQHDDRGENIAEALLGRDAEDDAGNSRANEQVVSRDTEHGQQREDQQHVPETVGDQANGRSRTGVRLTRHQSTDRSREMNDGVRAGDDENNRRSPAVQLLVERRTFDFSESLSEPDRREGYESRRDPDEPLGLERVLRRGVYAFVHWRPLYR